MIRGGVPGDCSVAGSRALAAREPEYAALRPQALRVANRDAIAWASHRARNRAKRFALRRLSRQGFAALTLAATSVEQNARAGFRLARTVCGKGSQARLYHKPRSLRRFVEPRRGPLRPPLGPPPFRIKK